MKDAKIKIIRKIIQHIEERSPVKFFMVIDIQSEGQLFEAAVDLEAKNLVKIEVVDGRAYLEYMKEGGINYGQA